jgi:hypothetical protein
MRAALSRFTSSLISLLDEATLTTDAAVEIRTEEIRQVMLNAISEFEDEQATSPTLWNMVTHAPSIQTLWYLRSDLLIFLSRRSGEKVASERLLIITETFRGVIPRSQMPKPGRTGR